MTVDLIMDWALSTGFDITILIALILVFRRPFGRMFGAAAAYSLWLLPLIRLFIPEIPITLPRPDWLKAQPVAPQEVFEFSSSLPVVAAPVSDPVNWQLPALIIWISVAVLWLSKQLAQQRAYVDRILQNSEPAPERVRRKLTEATKVVGLSRSVNVRVATSNVGPLVTGIFNPVIVLPDNFETDFAGRQQFFALTHELAHIKRFDLIAAFFTLAFRALNWPNPLVHFGSAKFRADQEAACDAYVLRTVGGDGSTKKTYAETLIHSARLSRQSQASSHAVTSNPLCLTIHHPLKERLMTMKTSTHKSRLLSRVGVAAFLAAGLAVTAPITIASAQDDPEVKTKIKKVIKSVENNDGVETSKTFEIIEEDGVKTIYSVDEHGNKTIVSEDELGPMKMMGGDIDIMVMEDGEPGQKRIKIMGHDGMHAMGDGDHGKIIVKRMKKGEDGQSVEADENVFVFSEGDYAFGEGDHAAAMVGAARSLLDQAEKMRGGEELSSKAKRKLEKARKALDEAQAALDAE
ncbi:MAG: hypothetical protein EX271_05465 [Acidimicrobiales bacterium]|nr:hypothetical protein [Hyphomonadaceae bacterium]RZV42648.1 MAG: hypothetical protein EX271_05465 [Acidimicrobiales bacterium]